MWSGIGPRYVYGSQLATSAKAADPAPSISTQGSETSAALRDGFRRLPREGEVVRTAALEAASELVHAPDDLRVEPDARGEPEAASVDPPERDAPRAVRLRGPRHGRPGSVDGVAREPQGAGEDARAAAGREPDRDVLVEAVQRFVEASVARVHDHGVDVTRAVADKLHRVLWALGAEDVDVGVGGERLGDGRDARLADGARVRVDDERDPVEITRRGHLLPTPEQAAPTGRGVGAGGGGGPGIPSELRSTPGMSARSRASFSDTWLWICTVSSCARCA